MLTQEAKTFCSVTCGAKVGGNIRLWFNMFKRSYSLGQTLLNRATATAASNPHMYPATMAATLARAVTDMMTLNMQERARVDDKYQETHRRMDENQRHMDGRLDANVKHVDGELGANVKHVDDKLESAMERFLKSNESLKTSLNNSNESLKTSLNKLNEEIKLLKEDTSKNAMLLKEEFHRLDQSIMLVKEGLTKYYHSLDKSVTLMTRVAAVFGSSVFLGILYKSGAFSLSI
ncbi:hypothetical protein Ndes2437A_g04649 [Nannochloris sp. 'desiccata']